MAVASFPRITIIPPSANPFAPPPRDMDPLLQALNFAAKCEADVKNKDRDRMEKKILM